MTHRGPCQPLPCWDSVILWGRLRGALQGVLAAGRVWVPHTCSPVPHVAQGSTGVRVRLVGWTDCRGDRAVAAGASPAAVDSPFALCPCRSSVPQGCCCPVQQALGVRRRDPHHPGRAPARGVLCTSSPRTGMKPSRSSDALPVPSAAPSPRPAASSRSLRPAHRITEWSGLEGTSVGHPVQPPAEAGSPTVAFPRRRDAPVPSSSSQPSAGLSPVAPHLSARAPRRCGRRPFRWFWSAPRKRRARYPSALQGGGLGSGRPAGFSACLALARGVGRWVLPEDSLPLPVLCSKAQSSLPTDPV